MTGAATRSCGLGPFDASEGTVDAIAGTLPGKAGETLGVTGGSGIGTSMPAGVIAGLDAPAGGQVLADVDRVGAATARDGSVPLHVGVVFQDPAASLDPASTA